MRRRALAIAITLVVAISALALVSSELGVDLSASRQVEAFPTESTAMNTSGPGIVWRTSAGRAYDINVGANGTTYTIRESGNSPEVGSVYVEARDDEGKLVFSKNINAAFYGQPVLGPDGNLRFLTATVGDDPTASLYCLNDVGEIVWERNISSDWGYFLWPSPQIIVDANGTTYFSLSDALSSSFDYSICAVSSSGELEWREHFDQAIGGLSGDSNGNGTVYALIGQELCALKDGDVLWNLTSPGTLWYTSQPGIATGVNGTIYVCSDYLLFAADQYGDLLWNISLPGRAPNGFSLGTKDTIYLCQAEYLIDRQSYNLYAYNNRGEQLWMKEFGDFLPSPTAGNGTIIVRSGNMIYGVDEEGTTIWSYDAGEQVQDVEVGDDGTLFFLIQGSGSTTTLVASHGIPQVTWIDTLARNAIIVLIVVVAITVILGLSFMVWKRTRNNRKLK